MINFSLLPRWVVPLIVVGICLSFIPLVLVYNSRVSNSREPRVSIIPDMDNQPRYKAQMADSLFADGRASRQPPAGTVPVGQLNADDHFFRGIVKDANGQPQWATSFPEYQYDSQGNRSPLEINAQLILSGKERFRIYCAMCHGLDGYGNGIVDVRATNLEDKTWVTPLSYHSPTVRARPVGHIFNTITNGIRTMPPYGPQVSPLDRWAIVAYVRALQRSQNATIEDVPADIRQELELRAQSDQPAAPPAAPATTTPQEAP